MKCKICGGKLKKWKSKLFDDRHGYPGYFDVKKCTNCEFGQTDPQLSSKKIADIYANYYPWKETDVKKVRLEDFKIPSKFKLWRKGLFINGQYYVKPNTDVLDVGCGLGYSLLELKNLGARPHGIDPDKNALKLAKKFKLNFKQGFITDNLFPNKSFDYVIANQVLEHTNDPLNFLKEANKKLNKGGRIILSFPNTNSLTRYLFNTNWLHWHIPYHLNFFNKNSIKILAKKSNLKIESMQTITPNMWTNLQLRRLAQKPSVGVRDEFWDGKINKDDKIMTKGIFPKIIYFLEEYNLLNRIIDSLGLGESFVVILRSP